MSYLAMSAAPVNNENEDNYSCNYLDNKKRQAGNTTRKRRENCSNDKVQSVLEKIHNSCNDDDDQDAFTLPQSAGMERIDTIQQQNNKNKQGGEQGATKESMVNMTSKNDVMFRTLGKTPQPDYDESGKLELNDYSNYGDEKSNEEYYKRILPGYLQQQQNQPFLQKNPNNKPYYNNVNYTPEKFNTEDNVLLQKMNYMITLLEDQQDERTNNVTEEVILYSFLGIFIIFIADTFVRAGKYTR
jgi:hypothetical protein